MVRMAHPTTIFPERMAHLNEIAASLARLAMTGFTFPLAARGAIHPGRL